MFNRSKLSKNQMEQPILVGFSLMIYNDDFPHFPWQRNGSLWLWSSYPLGLAPWGVAPSLQRRGRGSGRWVSCSPRAFLGEILGPEFKRFFWGVPWPWVPMGYPKLWMVFVRENPIYKWMMTGGTPFLGNHHFMVSTACHHTCFNHQTWKPGWMSMLTVNPPSLMIILMACKSQ